MNLDPTIIAAAFVTVIAAVVTGAVTVINAIAAAKERYTAAAERKEMLEKTAQAISASHANGVKADDLLVKTEQIHSLTNSTNSNLQKALEVATERISGMEKVIAEFMFDKREMARIIAIATASAATKRDSRATDANGPGGPGGPVSPGGPGSQEPVKVEVTNPASSPLPVVLQPDPDPKAGPKPALTANSKESK